VSEERSYFVVNFVETDCLKVHVWIEEFMPLLSATRSNVLHLCVCAGCVTLQARISVDDVV
jgi:hypothetical protein